MPLLQISIYLSSSRPLHTIWRKGGCRQALRHGHSLSSRISVQRFQNLAIRQHSKNADRICLGNRNGAARMHFTGKSSNSFLTFSELPSESGQTHAASQAASSEVSPRDRGPQCLPGLQLPHSMRIVKGGNGSVGCSLPSRCKSCRYSKR